jgi:putative two-component system response regulator
VLHEYGVCSVIPALAVTDGGIAQAEFACDEGAEDIMSPPFIPKIVYLRASNAILLYRHRKSHLDGALVENVDPVIGQLMEIQLEERLKKEKEHIYQMTTVEAGRIIQYLGKIFDVARLVHVEQRTLITIDDKGEIVEEPCKCYGIWNRDKSCSNCISSRVINNQSRVFKYELAGKDLYYVISSYIEVDDEPYALEIAFRVTDDKIMKGQSKALLFNSIAKEDKRIYLDSLTGAYNRRYYDEQMANIEVSSGVAMIDIDNFKHINDSYGHQAGDEAIRKISEKLLSGIRTGDTLIRFGGDEFILIFNDIPQEIFQKKLEELRSEVEGMEIPGCPDVQTTLSIGGVFRKGLVSELVWEADKVMYQAKNIKNSVQII